MPEHTESGGHCFRTALTGEHFTTGLGYVVYSHSIRRPASTLRIVHSACGLDAGMLGEPKLAIQHALHAESVKQIVGSGHVRGFK